MRHPLVHRSLLLLAVGLLAAAGPAACSDDARPSVDASGSSIAGMLTLVPNTGANRSQLWISLYAEAEAAADIEPDGTTGRERELRRLFRLTSDIETGTGVAPGILLGPRAQEQYGRLDFVPSDLAAEANAGEQPELLSVAVGDLDGDAVLGRAAEVDGATREDLGGTTVVRWLADNEVRRDLDTPVGSLPGRAGRIALPADGVLAYATTDAIELEAIQTVRRTRGSLAEQEDLPTVAARLDALDVHSAYLSTAPIELRLAGRMTPEQMERFQDDAGPALQRWSAIGVGAARHDGRAELVVVMVHGSPGSAEANAAVLVDRATDGVSGATGRPWSDVLSNPRVEQDGRTVVARFDVENPTLWSSIVQQQDTLLAVG